MARRSNDRAPLWQLPGTRVAGDLLPAAVAGEPMAGERRVSAAGGGAEERLGEVGGEEELVTDEG